MPVAYFTVGSTLFQDTPENRAAAAACMAAQKAAVPPAASADFAGVFDPSKVSFAERMLGKAMKMPVGDFRDWEAIQNWAAILPDLLAG
jgi:menaquinone-dependent protoporphyrinogen oxidase